MTSVCKCPECDSPDVVINQAQRRLSCQSCGDTFSFNRGGSAKAWPSAPRVVLAIWRGLMAVLLTNALAQAYAIHQHLAGTNTAHSEPTSFPVPLVAASLAAMFLSAFAGERRTS